MLLNFRKDSNRHILYISKRVQIIPSLFSILRVGLSSNGSNTETQTMKNGSMQNMEHAKKFLFVNFFVSVMCSDLVYFHDVSYKKKNMTIP